MLLPAPSVKIDNDGLRREVIEKFDTFLVDCDGVVWEGSTLIPGTKEFIELMNSLGKNLFFVTNNATKSRETYSKKFEALGISVSSNQVVPASYAAAHYIANESVLPEGKRLYVIGMEGLKEELDNFGVASTGYEDTDSGLNNIEDLRNVLPDPSIGAVLVSLDFNVNYRKLAKAHLYLVSDPSVKFIATNSDLTLPCPQGTFPGAGSIVEILRTSTKREPIILGKPTLHMAEVVKKLHKNFNPARTCVIGDRLSTDIQFGINNFLTTILVLSGVTKEADINSPLGMTKPTYYTDSLASLVSLP